MSVNWKIEVINYTNPGTFSLKLIVLEIDSIDTIPKHFNEYIYEYLRTYMCLQNKFIKIAIKKSNKYELKILKYANMSKYELKKC